MVTLFLPKFITKIKWTNTGKLFTQHILEYWIKASCYTAVIYFIYSFTLYIYIYFFFNFISSTVPAGSKNPVLQRENPAVQSPCRRFGTVVLGKDTCLDIPVCSWHFCICLCFLTWEPHSETWEYGMASPMPENGKRGGKVEVHQLIFPAAIEILYSSHEACAYHLWADGLQSGWFLWLLDFCTQLTYALESQISSSHWTHPEDSWLPCPSPQCYKPYRAVSANGPMVHPAAQARNPGLILETSLSFTPTHISSIQWILPPEFIPILCLSLHLWCHHPTP